MSDLIVVLPGIGGSVLARDGAPVWSPRPGAALRAALSLGKSISSLQLAGDDHTVDDLGDGITATALLPDLHIVPGLDWKIDGYGRLRQRLFERFDLKVGENYLDFPYDWRRDTRVAARRLARVAGEQLARWRTTSGNADAKLILIGHSMGGIVSRLFLEFEDGWKITRRLVTFGTPYSGSINALEFLVNGFRKGWGPFAIAVHARRHAVAAHRRRRPAAQRGSRTIGRRARAASIAAGGGRCRRPGAGALRHPPAGGRYAAYVVERGAGQRHDRSAQCARHR
ncbi:MAG: hypothetical protein MUE41_03325 [Gemmatimonadaceae bacterium]|nr:hypothetical protein [Gemmatimonadaceae bacterium]